MFMCSFPQLQVLVGLKAASQSIRNQHPDAPIAAFTYQHAKKSFDAHFDAVEHFGNIKGKNTFRDYKIIAQVGSHRYPNAYYAAHHLHQQPDLFPTAAELSAEERAAWSKSLLDNDDLASLRDSFMLVDLEQNLFRMPDCIEPIHYYVFCSTTACRTLIEKVRERFGSMNHAAPIVVESDVHVMKTIRFWGKK